MTCGVIISPSSSYDIDRRTSISAAELTMLLAPPRLTDPMNTRGRGGKEYAREMISLLLVYCAWASENMDLVHPTMKCIITVSMIEEQNYHVLARYGGSSFGG